MSWWNLFAARETAGENRENVSSSVETATLEPESRQISASSPLEERSSLENPLVSISDIRVMEILGGDTAGDRGLEPVTIEKALGVPACWCAVNFLSTELASLPFQTFKKTSSGKKRVDGGEADVLQHAVTDTMTSFDWRKSLFQAVMTEGRSYTFIERNKLGKLINLHLLDYSQVTPRRRSGVVTYEYRENGKTITYQAGEIIDIAFSRKPNGVGHRSPIRTNKLTFQMVFGAYQFSAKFFARGGVPPFAVTGPIKTTGGLNRASADVNRAIEDANAAGRKVLALPNGHDVKPLGVDPQKSQMIEAHRFAILEMGRLYNLPPAFLQDLQFGTFSNTEQQDLHLVKHTIAGWCQQLEQEVNLKIHGRGSKTYSKLILDGLLRGDFKSRMEGYGQAVQNGIMTPNEVRALEDREPLAGGDNLMIQGATVPLKSQPTTPQQQGDPGNAGGN